MLHEKYNQKTKPVLMCLRASIVAGRHYRRKSFFSEPLRRSEAYAAVSTSDDCNLSIKSFCD
jgi:hypothetical protein